MLALVQQARRNALDKGRADPRGAIGTITPQNLPKQHISPRFCTI